jgi:hypothetical protein
LFRAAQLASTDGADGPSAYYIERCQQLLAAPVDTEWSPVHVMKQK